MYQFSESARSKGIKIGFIGLVIVAICVTFITVIWQAPAKGSVEVLYLVLLVVVLLPGLLMLFTGALQIVRGGRFEVRVTTEEFQWLTPDYLGDSFHLRLDQIDHVEKRSRIKKSGKTKSSFSVVSEDGQHYSLSKQSSVPIQDVVDALVAGGVRVRELSARDTQ